jgi:hypothetical protein
MSRLFVIAGASLFAALGLWGQHTPESPAWRAELRSSGGFTGRGVGGVAVQADGTIALLQFGVVGGQGRAWEPTCTLKLPDRITPVADALRASKPETWRERYNPDGCCDHLQWDLEISRTTAGEPPVRARTSWIGDDAELPDDLGRLRKALQEAWNAAKTACSAK